MESSEDVDDIKSYWCFKKSLVSLVDFNFVVL